MFDTVSKNLNNEHFNISACILPILTQFAKSTIPVFFNKPISIGHHQVVSTANGY